MSRSKFKVLKGLAHVLTTGEPVFVDGTESSEGKLNVLRPVVTRNGIYHEPDSFDPTMLETPHAKAKRELAFGEFLQDLKIEAEDKRFALPEAVRKVLEGTAHQASNPSKKEGNDGR